MSIDCTYIGYCYSAHNLGESYFGYASKEGKADMWYDGADAWTPIDTNALATSGARFFKVSVGQ